MIMRCAQQRKRLTLLVASAAAILGVISGYLIWREVTLRLAMNELDHHALRYMLRAEDSSAASEHFLTTMAAAHLQACSDAEIVFMHHLLIQSEYVRDARVALSCCKRQALIQSRRSCASDKRSAIAVADALKSALRLLSAQILLELAQVIQRTAALPAQALEITLHSAVG